MNWKKYKKNIATVYVEVYNKKILTQSKSSFENVLNEIEKFYPVFSLDEFLDVLQTG